MTFHDPILESCNRSFNWIATDVRDFSVTTGAKVKQTWQGRSIVRHPEPKSEIDGNNTDLYITEVVMQKIPFFCWSLQTKGSLIDSGNESTKQDAIKKVYQAFYKYLTMRKCQLAQIPKSGKTIGIYGNWLNPDQYHGARESFRAISQIIPECITDSRDNLIFVRGWPSMQKDRAYAVIDSTAHNRINSSMFDYTIILQEGTKLTNSLDWYIKSPEEYITGEVQCVACKNIYSSVENMDLRFVRGVGLVCGPSRDERFDNEDAWS